MSTFIIRNIQIVKKILKKIIFFFIEKIDCVSLIILLLAITIYFGQMPIRYRPSIQTEVLNNFGYFNQSLIDQKWNSGLRTDILKQITNCSQFDCGPRLRPLHWLIELLQVKIDVIRIKLFGFTLYNYCGVFTNFLNIFLVFLLIYRLIGSFSGSLIGASIFMMTAHSLAVPFYWYLNKFKTITVFLFMVNIIVITSGSHTQYLVLREKFISSIKKRFQKSKGGFSAKEVLTYLLNIIYRSTKFLCLSINKNSYAFYILFFIVLLLNSFADEISLICILPLLFLVLFFRGVKAFSVCFAIATWVQLFWVTTYYLFAPKIYYYYWKTSWWNAQQDFFTHVDGTFVGNLLFGLLKPRTYRLLFGQLGAVLGYFAEDFDSKLVIFMVLGLIFLLLAAVVSVIKNRTFCKDKVFLKNYFIVSFSCIFLWYINSVMMGGLVFKFPYNYPLVVLAIPVGLFIGFCYTKISNRFLSAAIVLILCLSIFLNNARGAGQIIANEFRSCNCQPFDDNVVKPIQQMCRFVRKHWNKRPFYISYPNLTEMRSSVTPAGYSEKDMLFGFQTIIPAFFIRYFEKGDILSTITPYEKFYVKKCNPSNAKLFYDIFKRQIIDLSNLMNESYKIGDISYPSQFADNLNTSGQLGLPEIDSNKYNAFMIEFDIHLNKINMDKKVKIGFFFRSILQNNLEIYTPLKLILFEDGEKTKEIFVQHDYGYSFKFYELSLTKNEVKRIKLVIEQGEVNAPNELYRRNYILAGPFLFSGDIWQDSMNFK